MAKNTGKFMEKSGILSVRKSGNPEKHNVIIISRHGSLRIEKWQTYTWNVITPISAENFGYVG